MKKSGIPFMAKINSVPFKKFFIYGIVGVIGTFIHFLTLVLLVELFNQDPVFSSSIGFIFTVIISFILNKKFTFKTRSKNNSILFIKYSLVSISGFILNSLIMYLTVHVFTIHYFIGQAIVIIVLPISNFLLNHYWTFNEKMESL